ncbi:MAG: tetratricopeptide repeat protein [Chitinophagaceae bacterium]|nr:tetratricopeptide repeat protein [Chitinophagaceae bacterium]
MNKPISLSQIGLYNPQRVSDEISESLFVARTKVFDFLMQKITQEKPNSIAQHYLIIGQRGMGKTTLLKRIEVALRKSPYKEHFVPLLFPEEQYNLKHLAEFWLNSLDALADTLEVENSKEVSSLDKEIEELATIKNNDEVASKAFKLLLATSKKMKRRPVLLIDNLSLIFDRLKEEQQFVLRAQLMSNGAPIIMGASAVVIEDTFKYAAPFYDAFQILHLAKLTFTELIEILNNLASLTHSDDVLPIIQKEIARLKTIFELTGGNPRTVTMLFKLIVKGMTEEINDDLEALLDEATPLYKARFEELALQMQIVLDAIALNWDPIDMKLLVKETGYKNTHLSPILKRLIDVGWIERITAFKSKGDAFQISERFFNIWFVMRRGSRRQKKYLYCLSRFLETYYGPNIDEYANERLTKESDQEVFYATNLALAQVVNNKSLSAELEQRSLDKLRSMAESDPEIYTRYDIVREGDAVDLSAEQQVGKWLALIKQEPKNATYYYELGRVYNNLLENYPEAEKAILKAIDLNKNYSRAWNGLGNIYSTSFFERYTEAEEAYLKAIELDDKDAWPWVNLGILYQVHFQKYQEAENAYKKAIELDNKDSAFWFNLGKLYQEHFQKYEEAEMAYKKAIELDNKFSYPWNGLGNLYTNHFQKYEEAEMAYKKAIELDNKFSYPWNGLGNLYTNHFQKYEEAEMAYKKAIELDNKNSFPWNGLGTLYHDKLEWNEEAEKCYLKAIALDEKEPFAWGNLSLLYQYKLKDYDKLERNYLRAIVLDNNDTAIKLKLIYLYRDKLNKLNEAEKLFTEIENDITKDDSYFLNKSLFALYNNNQGIAKEFLLQAFEQIDKRLPTQTQNDWWRYGAAVNQLKQGLWFTNIMEETGYNIYLSPFYVALLAMQEKDREGFLLSKAAELREPAKQLIELMENI